MTDQQSHQQPTAGAPDAGQNPQQGYIAPGAQQGTYGQAQPQNPYGLPPQNPYGVPTAPAYGPGAEKPRRNYGMIFRVVGIVAFLGLVGGGYLVQKHNQADRNSDGNISKKGDLGAFSMKVGDCFKKPADSAAGFSSVKAIPCDQPHDAQAFYTFVYPDAGDTPPAVDTADAVNEPKCKDAIAAKLDEGKVPDGALLNIYTPDSASWKAGHHDIMCVMENATDITGSVMKG
ncbi:septum formation family protein [Catenulispora yoronensis]|uniref:Septum formation family protein n=1 Tax=Catenulispora yoronensis TaxID=450799 RepID=A0ABP5GRK4_9ACTN